MKRVIGSLARWQKLLLLIGVVTIAAGSYTIVPALLEAESSPPQPSFNVSEDRVQRGGPESPTTPFRDVTIAHEGTSAYTSAHVSTGQHSAQLSQGERVTFSKLQPNRDIHVQATLTDAGVTYQYTATYTVADGWTQESVTGK